MKKIVVALLAIVVFVGFAYADINIGASGNYNSNTERVSYSFLLEYLRPIIPDTLKIGLGAQYFSAGNTFNIHDKDVKAHFDINDYATVPVYLMARLNVPIIPVLSSFFLTGRYGYSFLQKGSNLDDGGRYYAIGLGKQILWIAYMELIYTGYHFNKIEKDTQHISLNIGVGF
jgi:hypothetical protein